MHRTCFSIAVLGAVVSTAVAAEPIKLRLGNTNPPRAHLNRQIFITWLTTSYYAGLFPRSWITALPAVVKQSKAASLALWHMYKNGVTGDEYDAFRILATTASPPPNLLHSTMPIRSIKDVKGKKLASTTSVGNDIARLLGASPVHTKYREIYQNLNRGVTHGEFTAWTAMQPLRLWEVAKYHTDVPLGGLSVPLVAMNKDSYRKLPAKGRQLIDRFTGEEWVREFGAFWDRVAVAGRERVEKDKSNVVIELDPAEKARWAKAIAPATEA